jgi:hypothetical protein
MFLIKMYPTFMYSNVILGLNHNGLFTILSIPGVVNSLQLIVHALNTPFHNGLMIIGIEDLIFVSNISKVGYILNCCLQNCCWFLTNCILSMLGLNFGCLPLLSHLRHIVFI